MPFLEKAQAASHQKSGFNPKKLEGSESVSSLMGI